MNIAICDDSPMIVGELEELARSCFVDSGCHIDVFYSGERLIDAVINSATSYQLYLLDVEMEEATGFDVAEEIRKRDSAAAIIFVTSHGELMQQAFEVSAFHYLIKPIDRKKAGQVLLRAAESLRARNAVFSYTARKSVHTVYLAQIEYVESLGRKIRLHMADGALHEYYGTLKEAASKVPSSLFQQVHSSYLVNMEWVRHMAADNLTLQSGAFVPVSKKYNKAFNVAYNHFIVARTG